MTSLKRETPAIPQASEIANVEVAAYFKYKPWVDRLITATLMVAALPVMAAVGLAILAKDGRPIFYRQTRVGKNGRPFRIWKFRTMQRNAESQTGAVWSCDSDPRVTQLGKWLRSSHLDELPQFFNVLAGDMNLIGPRPERPEFVNELTLELPFYLERIKVAPGITGLAQIRTGYDHSLNDVRTKVLLDLEYMQSASVLKDLKLVRQTCTYIFRHLWAARSQLATQRATTADKSRKVAYVSPKSCVGPQRELAICAVASLECPAPFANFIDNQITALAAQNLLGNDIEECV